MAILTEARTPNYDGTTSGDWSAPSFSTCVDAYYKHTGNSRPDDPVTDVSEAPQAMKSWIAGLSLLGSSKAGSFADLLFFPVVEPNSLNLNESALDAVISGRGSQAQISDEAKSSAQRKAYRLLNKEFGRDLELPDDLKEAKSVAEGLAEVIRGKAEKVKNM